MTRHPRPSRIIAAMALGFAAVLAGPIIPGAPCLSDTCGAKSAASPTADAINPVPGVFPQNSGKLHIAPQASDPFAPKKETTPIIPTEAR